MRSTTWMGAAVTLTAVSLSAILSGCGSDQTNGATPPGAGGSTALPPGGSGPGAGAGGQVVLPPGSPVPGRVTAHRLNALEYDNTIRDLLGLDLKPSEMFEFPADEFGDGFDNDADVLTVSSLSIEKYLEAALFVVNQALTDPTASQRIMVCDPVAGGAACVQQIVSEFGRRALRRPLEDNELAPYVAIVDQAVAAGDTLDVGLMNALAGVLMTPDFLYRIEPDPAPGTTRQLNGWEIASRLSYFIWASMPDTELFDRAQDGTLVDPAIIEAQITRMLADAKSQSLIDIMVEQWARTNALVFAEPSVEVYPTWQPGLLGAMEQEVRSLLTPIIKGEAPATDLLTANYVHANRMLGEFYGLPNAAQLPEDQFVKVTLTDTMRGGMLRQGSLLVFTSHPEVHSPSRRGKWVLEKLLCTRPPAPPADVPEFNPATAPGGTLRQKLETAHLANDACKACHAQLDPMGFALEHYDGVGLWRDTEAGLPVDASGVMPTTGVPFNGAAEVSELIVADPRFANCMAQQMLTYAMGRVTNGADDVAITNIGTAFAQAGYNWPRLLQLVAASIPMTHRQAE